MTKPITVRHRLVGARLRRYRQDMGYGLEIAARVLACDRSKVSRIENGQRGIRPEELSVLLTEYGVPDADQRALAMLAQPPAAAGWSDDYRTVMGSSYADFAIAEAAACHLQVYAPLLVPELLRTEAYASAIAQADPAIPGDAAGLAAEIAMTRQAAVLLQRRTGCTVILGEAALHQHAGGTGILREQLAHLTTLPAAHPHLTIRILPFTAGAHAADSGFSALQFAGAPDLGLVRIAGPAGGTCLDDPADIAGYARAFTHLSSHSLAAEPSAAHIRLALEAITPASRTLLPGQEGTHRRHHAHVR